MPRAIRLGIGFNETAHRRLREVCEKYDISHSRLIESLLLMPDEEIKRQVDRAQPLLHLDRKERAKLKRDISEKLDTLTPEQFSRLIENLNAPR